MESTTIIVKPLISEKATFESDENNRYLFQVDKRATKSQIKVAVEELYKVKVVGVNTLRRKGQQRRSRHGFWTTSLVKHAMVKVKEGQRIELF